MTKTVTMCVQLLERRKSIVCDKPPFLDFRGFRRGFSGFGEHIPQVRLRLMEELFRTASNLQKILRAL